MIKRYTMKKVLFFILLLLLFPLSVGATDYFVCGSGTTCNSGDGTGWSTGEDDANCGTSRSDPCLTIGAGIAEMAGGDTLYVGDGTYTGTDNTINSHNETIPDGTSASAMTTIRSENDFMVIIDRSGADETYEVNPLYLQDTDYVMIRGFKLIGIGNNDDGTGNTDCSSDQGCSGLLLRRADHSFIYRVIVEDGGPDPNETGDYNDSSVAVNADCSYVNFEECAFYGGGHYTFSSYTSDHVIIRNCVSRHDFHGDGGTSSFDNYSSSDVSVQNSIAIDFGSAALHYHDAADALYGGFSTHGSTGATEFLGAIAMNIRGPGSTAPVRSDGGTPMTAGTPGWMAAFWMDGAGTRKLENCVVIGASTGVMSYQNIDINNCTFMDVDNEPFLNEGFSGDIMAYVSGTAPTITNSIFYDATGYGVTSQGTNNYNLYNDLTLGDCYGGACNGANNVTYDPESDEGGNGVGLLYPTRIESGSSLASAGSGGGRLGADTTYTYGRSYSGTGNIVFHGSTGYNARQDGTGGEATQLMWPFPNEDVFRTHMRNYSAMDEYAPNDEAIDSDRGFCADGQTLTKYIWEYLGNNIPNEIYGIGAISFPGSQTITVGGSQTLTF